MTNPDYTLGEPEEQNAQDLSQAIHYFKHYGLHEEPRVDHPVWRAIRLDAEEGDR